MDNKKELTNKFTRKHPGKSVLHGIYCACVCVCLAYAHGYGGWNADVCTYTCMQHVRVNV